MLNFTRGQRNGLIVLSFFIMLFVFVPYGFKYLKKDYTSTFYRFEEEIDKAKIVQEQKDDENIKFSLFNFNPNTASEQEFKRLGLNNKQIKQILNYRNKNGYFYKKEDFSKIYAIDDVSYKRLESYIVIPNRKRTKKQVKNKKRSFHKKEPISSKSVSVEINSANTEQLKTVRGIGETFAKRIINYRNSLGGFVSKKQLLEVYGFNKEKYEQIKGQVWLDLADVRKIKVNFSTAIDFERHPYFSKKQAKEVIKNRTYKGRYKSKEDFKIRLKFSDELMTKIEKYLEF